MKNFAFVEVKNEDADRVIKAMKHGVTIKGRSVVVDRSEPAGKGKASPAPSKRGEKNSKIQNSKFKKDKRVKEEKSTSKRGDKSTKKFDKADWMQFLHPEEGWARRRPKKK